MTTWYRTNMSALTWAEVRRFAAGNPLEFLFRGALKLLRERGPLTMVVARSSELGFVEEDGLPADLLLALRGAEEQFHAAAPGFTRINIVRAETLGRLASASLQELSADGKIWAELVCVRMTPPGHAADAATLVRLAWFSSLLENGLRVWTGNTKRQFDSLPGGDACYLPGATVTELARVHAERLERLGRSSAPRVLDAQQVQQLLLAFAQQVHDFHVARGVYVPATTDELIRLRTEG